LCRYVPETHGPKLKDFREALADAPRGKFPEIDALKDEVEAFASTFPTIGFDKKDGKYTQSL
jgi:glycine hydroxymethyltransferase